MILIGSSAIKHWFPDFPREPKDKDYIRQGEHEKSTQDVEYHTNLILANYHSNILSPDYLYTLKISHAIGWDINWEKHVYDIQFLKGKGCVVNKILLHNLYNYWNTVHEPNNRSKLSMSADDFFDNAVKCPYDHDYLHTLLNPYPTFNKVLKDGAEVDVCETKFNLLSFEEKCSLVTEEVMIMAYERWSSLDYRTAYSKMLKKFIINHAPIWEAVFILENFIHLHKPHFNYIKTINNGL
jgi:hypothetical protein